MVRWAGELIWDQPPGGHLSAPLENARLAMSWLKFFLNPTVATGAQIDPAWKDDPLRHPEVQRMSLREIADLPLGVGTGFHAETRSQLAKCA
ncbi:hypothetical protein REMIM1_CH01157 [Rhizobium etli bv. mimosae str. Mim1]|nr:hypothetical protein REMIM1_CH01157 [Rhizobium etli bv. mimosae str. Mim1]